MFGDYGFGRTGRRASAPACSGMGTIIPRSTGLAYSAGCELSFITKRYTGADHG
jgi:hypothetical protein